MALYAATCKRCGEVDIAKGMDEPFPETHDCGGSLVRRFTASRIIYNVPGFTGYDEQPRRHMKPERYEKFARERERIRRGQ